MSRQIHQGAGWRLGWDQSEQEFQGLLGTDEWAVELTRSEMQDFSTLFQQLARQMTEMQAHLMPEETLACEAQTTRVWLEVAGNTQAYALRMILLIGRKVEGEWSVTATQALLAACDLLPVTAHQI
ncbi:DUF1818 family protein [Thermosynechococcaceae cyanobacterium BACA0444]|uniref:DUF1818 family protein n=1 Tax=Pseudocalidococcus azoricus BACA0444 TaxID=2918990 RepID=A0AAE4FQR7_9CYAN|nr:DUF1818 family protein [Pseudocalidococcus azoricus]MDS3859792.1 DUF1818 family protein [Pseudocalidococcus azoricus BACA0444]